MDEAKKEDIEKTWDLVKSEYIGDDGLVDWDKFKEKIHYNNFIEEQVTEVYCTITGGKLSYPNYYAGVVISAYEEELNKLFVERPRYIDLDFAECDDWISWATNAIDNGEQITADEKLITQYHTALFNYVENSKTILKKLEEIKKAKNVKDAKAIAEEIIKDNITD